MALQCLVVMGVCGSGKSEIGARLSARLGYRFIEGDDFHPQANRDKMHAGTPLDDDDRQGWLLSLAQELARAREQGVGVVLACSALKRRYRDLLRQGDPALRLVYLRATPHQVATRMQARQGHFMPIELVDSQFADLEPPQYDELAVTCSIDPAPEQIVESIMVALAA